MQRWLGNTADGDRSLPDCLLKMRPRYRRSGADGGGCGLRRLKLLPMHLTMRCGRAESEARVGTARDGAPARRAAIFSAVVLECDEQCLYAVLAAAEAAVAAAEPGRYMRAGQRGRRGSASEGDRSRRWSQACRHHDPIQDATLGSHFKTPTIAFSASTHSLPSEPTSTERKICLENRRAAESQFFFCLIFFV